MLYNKSKKPMNCKKKITSLITQTHRFTRPSRKLILYMCFFKQKFNEIKFVH